MSKDSQNAKKHQKCQKTVKVSKNPTKLIISHGKTHKNVEKLTKTSKNR